MKQLRNKILVASFVGLTAVQAQAQEPVDSSNISETNYQDWIVRCEQVEGVDQRCIMTQLAQIEETGEWLMQANIAYIPERTEPIMSIVLPLGVSLADGIKLQLGEADENANVLGYTHCDQSGCFVNQLLADEAIQRITAAESGSVTFTTLQGEAVQVPFSPMGFTEALASLRD